MTGTARWAELKLEEFEERLAAKPVAYLPMGLCEPHGHAAAMGLDLLKADYICDQAAARFGGIVAPSQGYHIHETGYHAPFLRETVGAANPRLAALPPDVILRTLLFQLRAFVNAGFRTVVVVSGHNGAQADLRLVAAEFSKLVTVPVIVHSDPELAAGRYPGDHAGKFELSQLMYGRPELVDLSRVPCTALHPAGRCGSASWSPRQARRWPTCPSSAWLTSSPPGTRSAPCGQTGSVWDLSPDRTRPVSIPRSKPKES